MTIDSVHVSSVVEALCDVANKRAAAAELSHFDNAEIVHSSDEDQDSQHPAYDSFNNSIGPDGIEKMRNISMTEIQQLFETFETALTSVWNHGRRKRCAYSVLDVLFMILAVYKKGSA